MVLDTLLVLRYGLLQMDSISDTRFIVLSTWLILKHYSLYKIPVSLKKARNSIHDGLILKD